jgi:hypothetical protein
MFPPLFVARKIVCRHGGFRATLGGALLVWYSFACQCFAEGDNSFSVPESHPVYDLIDALPLPSIAGGVDLTVRPLSEKQVITLLTYALSNHLVVDAPLARRYLNEFEREDSVHAATLHIGDATNRLSVYPYLATAFQVQDSNYSERGYGTFSVDSLSNKNEVRNETNYGIRLRALVFNAPVFFEGTITTEYSSVAQWVKTDDPRLGQNFTTILSARGAPGHFMGFDQFTTYFKIPNPFLDVTVGNQPFEWGYSPDMGFLFSGQYSPFFNVRIDKKIGKLDYEFVMGKLVADTYAEQKYVYAKRLTYQPFDWASIGFSDQEITMNRSVEPLYLLPFVPYYFTGHYLGDPDNLLLAFDGQVRIKSIAAVYGQLGIDDVKDLLGPVTDLTRSGNKDWGNKWSGLLGIKLFRPFPWFESLVKLEVLQTEPWTYTTSANATSNYPVQFGQLLGNEYGPHARVVRVVCDGQLSNGVSAQVTLEQLWKGKDPSGPGSPGSSVGDVNPAVLDTVNGSVSQSVAYPFKNDRFTAFSRNRTYLAASVSYRPNAVWSANAGGALVFEREPTAGAYYQVGIGASLNY